MLKLNGATINTVTVTGNTVVNPRKRNGTALIDFGAGTVGTITITENVFTDVSADADASNGLIRLPTGKPVTSGLVARNTFKALDPQSHAIYWNGPSTDALNVTSSGVVIEDNFFDGWGYNSSTASARTATIRMNRTGGDIVAGDLNIEKVSDSVAFYDVSDDRSDATTAVPGTGGTVMGHTVEDTWRIVPGDTVAAVFEADVTLVGDNMVATLSLDGIGAGNRVNTGMAYSYEVYEGDEKRVDSTPLPDPDDADTLLLYLAATETGQEDGLPDAESATPVYAMTDETETLTVIIYGTFDVDTEDRDQVTVTDTLGSLTLLLEQVRDAGAVFQ